MNIREEQRMYENDFYSGEKTGSDTTGSNELQRIYDDGFGRYQTYKPGGMGGAQEFQSYNSSTAKSPKKPHKKHSFLRKALISISLGLLFGIFGGAGFFTIWQVREALTGNDSQPEVLIDEQQQLTASDSQADTPNVTLTESGRVQIVEEDWTEVTEEVMPSMVAIDVSAVVTQTDFFGQTHRYEQEGGGSGIIVGENDTELLIVTNAHVVADVEEIEVVLIDETKAQAQVKGSDPNLDVAVIAISLDSLSQSTKDSIKIATMGDSDSLKLGEPVIAIGNALGYGQSVTDGMVSGLNREITLEDGFTGTFIQTNAAINPGNSGGALLNAKGEVIGINSNKLGGTIVEGMGFAIPISAAKPIISELFTREIRVKASESGYLGISNPQAITDEITAIYSIPKGLYITQVSENSPASRGGLLAGDIITEFEEQSIYSYDDLVEVLTYYGPDQTVKITVMRQESGIYEEVELTITLGKRPSNLR
jgi:serine protease Do